MNAANESHTCDEVDGDEDEDDGDRDDEGTDPDMYPSETAFSGDGCCTITSGMLLTIVVVAVGVLAVVISPDDDVVVVLVAAGIVLLFSVRLFDEPVVVISLLLLLLLLLHPGNSCFRLMLLLLLLLNDSSPPEANGRPFLCEPDAVVNVVANAVTADPHEETSCEALRANTCSFRPVEAAAPQLPLLLRPAASGFLLIRLTLLPHPDA